MKQLTEEQRKILAEVAARAAQLRQAVMQAEAEYHRLVMMAAPEGAESFDAERGIFYTSDDVDIKLVRDEGEKLEDDDGYEADAGNASVEGAAHDGPELELAFDPEEDDDYVPDVNNARIPE